MTHFDKTMRALHSAPDPSRVAAKEKRLAAFERHIEASLPSDYRDFVTLFGGMWVSASCPIAEPTPCGRETLVQAFYGFMKGKHLSCDLKHQSDLAEGASAAIPIASGAFGSQLFLVLTNSSKLSLTKGSVYFRDCENRSAWPDNHFRSMFSSLAPEIEDYLEFRRNGELPPKPEAIRDFYLVSPSFTDFRSICVPDSENEDG